MRKPVIVFFQGIKFPYQLFYLEESDYVMLCIEEEYFFNGYGRTPAKAFDMLLADCQMFLTDYEEGLHSRSDNLKELYDKISSFIEKISKRRKTYSKKYHFAAEGYKLPQLICWNVESRQNTFLSQDKNVLLVSGQSPTVFKQLMKAIGKDAATLMWDTLSQKRYEVIRERLEI